MTSSETTRLGALLLLLATCGTSCAAPGVQRPTATTRGAVVAEGDCSIVVGDIISFEVFRGGYRSAEWIDRLSPEDATQARGEDEFDAHGRCVLEVRIGRTRRAHLHVVSGAWMQGPQPSREQCLAERIEVARHLMTMTAHCADLTGRSTLTEIP